MKDNFDLAKHAHLPRLRALFCLQDAATALRDLYLLADNEDERRQHLKSAGQLHTMAEQMQKRWKVT